MRDLVVLDHAPRRAIPIDRQLARASDQDLPEYVTLEEAHRIAAAARSERDRILILTLWNTGARVSEVLQLRRSELDPRGRCLTVANLKQKNKSARKVVFLNESFTLEL